MKKFTRFLFDTWYGAIVVWTISGVLALGLLFVFSATEHWEWVGDLAFLVHLLLGLTVFAAIGQSLAKQKIGRAIGQFVLGGIVAVPLLIGWVVVSFAEAYSPRHHAKFNRISSQLVHRSVRSTGGGEGFWSRQPKCLHRAS